MNLPVDAVEFLDAFIGLFNNANPLVWSREGKPDPLTFDLPMIHVYGFTFCEEKEKALDYFTERIGTAMKYEQFKKEDIFDFHNIRDVSPQSHMYSVSFKLPVDVAFRKEEISEQESGKDQIYQEFEDASRKKMQKLN